MENREWRMMYNTELHQMCGSPNVPKIKATTQIGGTYLKNERKWHCKENNGK